MTEHEKRMLLQEAKALVKRLDTNITREKRGGVLVEKIGKYHEITFDQTPNNYGDKPPVVANVYDIKSFNKVPQMIDMIKKFIELSEGGK